MVSPDAIQAILMAVISTLGLTQAGKKLLERLVSRGSAALPMWAKQYVLPVVSALALALASGTLEPLSGLPAAGITVPVIVGLLSSAIYRLVKGQEDETA